MPCHARLKCWHEQNHGGKCDKCGADFAQFQGVYLAQVIAEEMNDTQNELNHVNAVANTAQMTITAMTSPLAASILLIRGLYSRFLT